jgi:spore germination cell wall hydrolase CwlJ-like protein
MKFTVGFYRSGDCARSSLIAECVVDATDTMQAKALAMAQLTSQYPEVAQCRFYHVETYQPPKPGFPRA